MNKLTRIILCATLTCALLGIGVSHAEIDEYADLNQPKKRTPIADKSSWSFTFDNDLLVPGSRDQDYTYGFSVIYTGNEADRQSGSLHEALDWLNLSLGLNEITDPGIQANKIEYGLFGFTPEDISLSGANPDDRPYASLLFVSSSREAFFPSQNLSWQSTLTVGFLGLDIVGDIQNLVHSVTDGTPANGWDNQISDGGEPTARYNLSRQKLLYSSNSGTELKYTLQGSVGYITETSISLSLRTGTIQSPWVTFNPELTSYGEKSAPNSASSVAESYFWTGISLKYRPYNAFLEGQFRDSAVTFDDDEINRGIIEAWLGYTVALSDGYSFTYSIRGHTSEINTGSGDRNVVWGGIQISKNIS